MSDIDRALAQILGRRAAYQLYTEYYDGRHRLSFATEKFRNAFGTLLREFAYNLCPSVIDAVADRLEVIRFDVEGGDGEGDPAWGIWQANRMDQRAGEVHQEALRAGDAYVIVWPDPDGQVTLYPQRAERMAIQYDDEAPGRVLWATKVWRNEAAKRWRLNLYYPDRIEKHQSRSGELPERESGFRPFEEEPVVENPWGTVPVFHFANNGPIGGMGRSELRDVIPLQDALNKAVCDMLVAMEFQALPQRWATGAEVEVDETTGKPKAPFLPGGVWTLGDPNARFGEFGPADLTQFLEVQLQFGLKIARVAGIPSHYLALISDPPSGEALKTLEARFVKKCRDRQAAFGNTWEDALRLALRMAGRDEARLSCQWEDPAPASQREQAETGALLAQAGVPRRQVLRDLGYSEAQIEQMLAEDESASADVSERLLSAFDRGER